MSNNALYSFNNKYDNFSDEELISKIRKNDLKAQNYLLKKKRNLVNMK